MTKLPMIFQQLFILISNLNFSDIISPQNGLESTVGNYVTLSQFAENFWAGFAVLSLAIALFNLVPIPFLDGGQVVLAFLTSFLKLIKVPKNMTNYLVYSLFLMGFAY